MDRQIEQEASGGFRRLQGGFRRLQGASGGFRRLQEAYRRNWHRTKSVADALCGLLSPTALPWCTVGCVPCPFPFVSRAVPLWVQDSPSFYFESLWCPCLIPVKPVKCLVTFLSALTVPYKNCPLGCSPGASKFGSASCNAFLPV